MICPCMSTRRARSSWRWWARGERTRCRCSTWWGSCWASRASCRPTQPTRWRWPSPTPTCAPARSAWAWARARRGAGSEKSRDSGFGIRDSQKRRRARRAWIRVLPITNHQSPIPAHGACAMIGRLKGTLVHKQPPWLVVDVHGVGYELEAPMSTFYDLPAVGGEVALFTHYAQKEDSVSLY